MSGFPRGEMMECATLPVGCEAIRILVAIAGGNDVVE